MNNNTDNPMENDEIELCEDCALWSCDCVCDEISAWHREIYLSLRG